ncbi:bactofilin family protein [Halolamina litorea]|uniref:bactofilin family protein n=1 Tax=Halolamina litorea TaxID=1515593 RepID=UPI0022712478|nr:polymer-forming cytoskeletal protein [Halolamina litorea]
MLPRASHRTRRIASIAAVFVVLLSLVSGVAAAQTGQFGDTIVVAEGETVDGLEGVAGTIVVRGTVTGDVSGAAGTIRITETGTVEGNVQAAAGTVIVAGTVEGDVQVGAGSFDLTDTGTVVGNLDVGAGAVTVDGAVEGDVQAAGTSVRIGPNADVGGEFRYDAETFERGPGATVAGGVVRDPSLGGATDGFVSISVPSWVDDVYSFFADLVLGIVLLLAFPRFSETVADRTIDGAASAGVIGLVALVGVPILLVIALITIVGIPFALVGIVLFALSLWVGSVYGQYAVGRWALSVTESESRWVALFAGVLGFLVIGLIPIVGGLAEFIVLLLGLGALLSSLYGRYRREPEPIEGIE